MRLPCSGSEGAATRTCSIAVSPACAANRAVTSAEPSRPGPQHSSGLERSDKKQRSRAMFRHPHHCWSQQPSLDPVSRLQLFQHMMIRYFVALHYLNGLMHVGIKRLALGGYALHVQLLQHVLELLMDQFHALAQVLGFGGRVLERKGKAVDHRQQ